MSKRFVGLNSTNFDYKDFVYYCNKIRFKAVTDSAIFVDLGKLNDANVKLKLRKKV